MLVPFAGVKCSVVPGLYGNRRLALVLIDREKDEVVCLATINYPGVEKQLGPGEFLVADEVNYPEGSDKIYTGEEEGILYALWSVDLVTPTGKTMTIPGIKEAPARKAHVCIKGPKYVEPENNG